VRLGILGPAQGDLVALARAARQLVDEARADKVLYLSDDDALDRVVSSWAGVIVRESEPGESLFDRAARRCAGAPHDEIEAFLAAEHARLRLQVFGSLPRSPGRTIELFDAQVVLFVYDKATLDEEDIAAAAVLVYGCSVAPMIKRVGARLFVTPGPIGASSGGRAILDDSGGGVDIRILDPSGKVTARETVGGSRAGAKMRVQGDPGGT
jgi:hypothetical protein